MLYAINEKNQKIEAQPALRGICPGCRSDLRAKCGDIKIWHWAHISTDCVQNWEPETEWHLNWKKRFPADWAEVVVGDHRADIKTKDGTVIEFQNSSISLGEALARELHYGDMVWVINGTEWPHGKFKIKDNGDYCTFTWNHSLQWAPFVNKPVYLDLGKNEADDRMFIIKKHHGRSGWGRELARHEFVHGFSQK